MSESALSEVELFDMATGVGRELLDDDLPLRARVVFRFGALGPRRDKRGAVSVP